MSIHQGFNENNQRRRVGWRAKKVSGNGTKVCSIGLLLHILIALALNLTAYKTA
jgi:hypothetical protein